MESLGETPVQDDPTPARGAVFAKVDFQGILQASYVRLILENTAHPARKFELYMGERGSAQEFPWNVKNVQTGYFFVELPPGEYRIASFAIPVGSTLAVEEADVRLQVFPGAIVYAGTLKAVGTKERIRLGGVPVIKPGFEYTVDVLNDYEEGVKIFRERYPDVKSDIWVKLMRARDAKNSLK